MCGGCGEFVGRCWGSGSGGLRLRGYCLRGCCLLRLGLLGLGLFVLLVCEYVCYVNVFVGVIVVYCSEVNVEFVGCLMCGGDGEDVVFVCSGRCRGSGGSFWCVV